MPSRPRLSSAFFIAGIFLAVFGIPTISAFPAVASPIAKESTMASHGARLLRWSERVLSRLEQAEAREVNPHFQDDCRVAWITVLRAARGESIPFVSATYTVLGIHPEKVWPSVVAWRHASLGARYGEFWGEELPPKKPVQSERRIDLAAQKPA